MQKPTNIVHRQKSYTSHKRHENIKPHSSCITRGNGVGGGLCLEPSERSPARTSAQLMVCSTAVRLHGAFTIHPKITHFFLITTIKQVLLATEEKNVSSRAQASAWNTVEKKHRTQNYWGGEICLEDSNNPVMAPYRGSSIKAVNLRRLFDCCWNLELHLLKEQTEQVSTKESKGSEIVFGA